ncbi:MAG TPA: hypothetical protein VOA78_06975 [Candidatus Dormibacteraeota bacterium]|nr:hypothetical protein [Candidatus Dormibacteraeota bacterium]
MNFRAAILPGQMNRKPLLALGFLVLGGFAAYKAAEYVLNDDLTGLALVALGLIVCACIVAMLNNWRNGLYFFLVWLLFEDFARKYLGNNMAIYFGKDLLVLVVYVSFYMAMRRHEVKTFRPPFLMPLLLFIWFGAMQAFNPGSTSIWFGPLGLKVYFLYVPLLFVGYALLNSEAQLRRFFTVNQVLALIIIGLGIAQAILGHTFLNPQTIDSDIELGSKLYRVSPITGLLIYRPCSVFVSHGRYSDFLLVAWLLVLGFSGYLLLRHRRGRWLAFVSLAVTTAGLFLAGSRGLFMWMLINVAATTVAFMWGAPWRQGEVVRVLRTLQRLAVGMVLAMALLFLIFPEALTARLALYSESLLPGNSANELGRRTWDYPIQNLLGAFNTDRWPYGYGIGTASLGTQYVARFFKAKLVGVSVESGFGTLVVEMGIVGLILWLVMSGAIVFSAWKAAKKLKGSPWFPLAFIIFWYSFVLLFAQTYAGMQSYQDFLMNAYLWLLLGILFRLPSLGLAAQQTAVAEQTARSERRWMR